jgi:hypothetical protein
LVFLDFADHPRWAEIPLLTNDFFERVPTIRRPSQNELLRAPGLVFLKNQAYASERLRLIED